MTKPALCALAVLALVGCSPAGPAGTASSTVSSAPASPISSAAPSVSAPAAHSTEPSIEASPSAAADIDVATVLPKTAGGHPLVTHVLTAAQVAQGDLKQVASYLELDLSTVKEAVATGGATGKDLVVTVIQVPGADAVGLAKTFQYGTSAMGIAGAFKGTSQTAGGRSVLVFGPAVYMYFSGNTAFQITADAAVAEEILAALP